MSRVHGLAVLALGGWLAMAQTAHAQTRPYIGYVYPAGGQQGTTFQVKLGGQALEGIQGVSVSGTGVSGKLIEYFRKMGPQDMQLISEQLRDLKRGSRGTALASATAPASSSGVMMTESGDSMMSAGSAASRTSAAGKGGDVARLIARLETRIREYVQRPACASIASLAVVEVTMAPDAKPGPREIRLVTSRGISNPLVFHVGQVPEVSRTPMVTAAFQVLGKEWLALRNRPADEVEQRVAVPCTMNGQIASGEVNRYRFEAHKGQRLVISTVARQLIPYIADAVPGWFQPVLTLCDASGKEVAYDDDYRFSPDPLISYQVPKDGEYVLSITDAIYRGREDFVYRITLGELPFVTSIFPLGGRVGAPVSIEMQGWNLQKAHLAPPAADAGPGIYPLVARQDGFVSNRVPFALDTLPEAFDKEPNNDQAHAQKVQLPVIINGRMDRPDDWDVFQFAGRAGETIVAEVYARRLDSPLDSLLKVTDASGKLLAMNDDHEDAGSGVNTHHADSYVMVKLPADGNYYVHLGDAARNGGEEYGYRLRISAPRPDFALRVVPSSISLRSKSSNTLTVYAIRKDGFSGTIKLGLKNPPPGFSLPYASLSGTQPMTKFTLKCDLLDLKQPVSLSIEGRATVGSREIARVAVPAEDRMQAFLWRHLVPAEELKVAVYNPSRDYALKRVRRTPAPPSAEAKPAAANASGTAKFTKQQVAGRLRQIQLLYDEGLITDEFNDRKVAECEGAR